MYTNQKFLYSAIENFVHKNGSAAKQTHSHFKAQSRRIHSLDTGRLTFVKNALKIPLKFTCYRKNPAQKFRFARIGSCATRNISHLNQFHSDPTRIDDFISIGHNSISFISNLYLYYNKNFLANQISRPRQRTFSPSHGFKNNFSGKVSKFLLL